MMKKRVKEVLSRLDKHNIKLNKVKCEFMVNKVKILGCEHFIRPDRVAIKTNSGEMEVDDRDHSQSFGNGDTFAMCGMKIRYCHVDHLIEKEAELPSEREVIDTSPFLGNNTQE